MYGDVMEGVEYFKESGQLTEEVLKIVKKYAEANKIRDIVVASTTGATGVKASEIFKGYNLVVVTHSAGFKEPGKVELLEENRIAIEKNGGRILTTTHALSGVERSLRKRFNIIGPLEQIAYTLRLFGQGTKVCVEIAIMAADAGLIPIDKDVISIGGTSRGADTAIVLKPAYSSDFFDLKIRKILCKPSNF
ncbi:MAG: pyruvate kinase alpha/beta domain-containing protein [Nitrososphaeria archaeon]